MKTRIFISIAVGMFVSAAALAVPTLQVYIDGAAAGNYNGDQDTWFTSDNAFDLIVVGAYGPKTTSIDYGTLVASIPQGQTGTITVNGATLLTTLGSNGPLNPAANADIDVLTNVVGIDGYSTKVFTPDNFNEHYPFQEGVSNFVLYDVGSFSDSGPIHNYNADGGIISLEGSGEEKTFSVVVSGFDSVHFDVYAYETNNRNQETFVSTWQINPGSHDAAYIPAPGALLLATIGIGIVGKLRRLRMAV
ncbi:MAG: choice-of-anchor N protein [Phycisphaerae bacterium]|nr:choice-of-anchor N protein [Phycisphaerae bacterium]